MRFIILLTILLSPGLVTGAERVVAYEIVNAREIPDSLTGAPGDAERGRKLYFDRVLTRCSGCHGSPGGPGAQSDAQASDAPSLAGVGSRLSEGSLRLWLVAPSILASQTGMPTYYKLGQRADPNDPRYGEPLLSAQEVEDLVAYLLRQQ